MADSRELLLPQHFREGNPAKIGGEFDASEYLTVLTHLSMQQGYVLDYVYFMDQGAGGEPIIYARSEAEPAYRTYSEFYQETGITINTDSRYDYLNHVLTDGTQEGFVEFIILRIIGGQFYLFWHARYNDDQIICDMERLEAIVGTLPDCKGRDSYCLTRRQKRQARKIRVEPVVEFGDDTVTVQVVTFSSWSGFVQRSYTIRQSFSHETLEQSATTLVPYDCGLRY